MSKIVETNTISHKKFTIPIPWDPQSNMTVTYYIAVLQAKGFRGTSDFQIHSKIKGNDEGYGGAVLEFLMEDGTVEKVKGPFYQYKEQNPRILWDILTGVKW